MEGQVPCKLELRQLKLQSYQILLGLFVLPTGNAAELFHHGKKRFNGILLGGHGRGGALPAWWRLWPPGNAVLQHLPAPPDRTLLFKHTDPSCPLAAVRCDLLERNTLSCTPLSVESAATSSSCVVGLRENTFEPSSLADTDVCWI